MLRRTSVNESSVKCLLSASLPEMTSLVSSTCFFLVYDICSLSDRKSSDCSLATKV